MGGRPAAACSAPGQPCSQAAVAHELARTCDRRANAAHARAVLQRGGERRTLDGVYHVGLLNNWRDVVADQLSTLVACGVLDVARSLTVSYQSGKQTSPGAAAELAALVRGTTAGVAAEVRLVPSAVSKPPWEAAAIDAVAAHCSSSETNPTLGLVFYLHSKGVTRHRPDW